MSMCDSDELSVRIVKIFQSLMIWKLIIEIATFRNPNPVSIGKNTNDYREPTS